MTKTMIKHEEEFIHVPKGLFYTLFVLAVCASMIYAIWNIDWASIISQFDEKNVGFSLEATCKIILSLGILASAVMIFLPKSRDSLISGLILGLIFGMIWGLILGLMWGLIYVLITGLILGLMWGLILGLILGLIE